VDLLYSVGEREIGELEDSDPAVVVAGGEDVAFRAVRWRKRDVERARFEGRDRPPGHVAVAEREHRLDQFTAGSLYQIQLAIDAFDPDILLDDHVDQLLCGSESGSVGFLGRDALELLWGLG